MISNKNIDEAIEHLKDLLDEDEFGCDDCRREHEELLEMLEELKNLRNSKRDSDTKDTKIEK